MSPYEKLFGKTPDYSALRTFGCACFPTLRDYASHKFDPRSLKCVFLGYSDKHKGYRCLYPPTGRVYISRHVIFDETNFPFANIYLHLQQKNLTPLYHAWQQSFMQPNSTSQAASSVLSRHQESQQIPIQFGSVPPLSTAVSSSQPGVSSEDCLFNESDFPLLASRPSTYTSPDHSSAASGPIQTTQTVSATTSEPSERAVPDVQAPQVSTSTANTHSMLTRAKTGIVKPNPRYVLMSRKVAFPTPKTVSEALKDEGWTEAMTEEYVNCKETKTFSLVPRSPNMNVLRSLWVFRNKLNADDTFGKRRARVVAKGNLQEEGIDYLETYSPVVRTATVRIVLHIATIMNSNLKQMDVQNAFLHGDLTETVYMTQPAGFVDKDHPDHVWLLHKFLYGLKQSARAWFDKFSLYLLEFGFLCSIKDPSLFIFSQGKDVIMLLLYVDDMVITGNESQTMQRFLQELKGRFRMKDMGQLHYFLGIQAQFHTGGMFLSQQAYAEDLLAVASMEHCTPMPTPLPTQPERTRDQDEAFSNPTYFRSLARKLQYLTLTRPDIQFAVNYVCQKMHKPTVSDFQHLKRILRYVKGTVTMGISFNKFTDSILRAYSDSDWDGCKETSRSTGGYCTFLGHNLISWSSRKQPTISKSSTEAEYRSLSETASEITWVSHILKELGVPLPVTPELYCDNLSAVLLTANPAFHSKMKHFTRDHHYVRERVGLGTLLVKHIPGLQQIEDIFTKSLPVSAFHRLRIKLV